MKLIGNPPIHPFWLIVGKLSFVVCVLYFFAESLFGSLSHYESMSTKIAGILLFLAGGAVLFLGIADLGKSTYMGLPTKKTELKTQGLYKISRNPIYVGLFLLCIGSCLYAVHPVNLVCAFLSTIIHHRIILAEERFLASRFGSGWENYRQKVRRYL
jgi:protein-S-isoprenylcysteine O-methyltransferase Ste14